MKKVKNKNMPQRMAFENRYPHFDQNTAWLLNKSAPFQFFCRAKKNVKICFTAVTKAD